MNVSVAGSYLSKANLELYISAALMALWSEYFGRGALSRIRSVKVEIVELCSCASEAREASEPSLLLVVMVKECVASSGMSRNENVAAATAMMSRMMLCCCCLFCSSTKRDNMM